MDRNTRRGRKAVVRDFSCRYHGQRDCICPCISSGYRFVDPAMIVREPYSPGVDRRAPA
jgi:hypothetical protein